MKEAILLFKDKVCVKTTLSMEAVEKGHSPEKARQPLGFTNEACRYLEQVFRKSPSY